MAIRFTAWKHMHFTVEQVVRSTKSPQYTHRARMVCAPGAHRVLYSPLHYEHGGFPIGPDSGSATVSRAGLPAPQQCQKLRHVHQPHARRGCRGPGRP